MEKAYRSALLRALWGAGLISKGEFNVLRE